MSTGRQTASQPVCCPWEHGVEVTSTENTVYCYTKGVSDTVIIINTDYRSLVLISYSIYFRTPPYEIEIFHSENAH